MVKPFEFATATRIIFGADSLAKVGSLTLTLGRRPLVVTGRDTRRSEPVLDLLTREGIESATFPVAGEPHLEHVRQGTRFAQQHQCDCVISFGGGSAIDAGKAIAALLTNPGDVLDYVELIGRGKTLGQRSAPFIAIPTTAGTGSEVTRNAVLASPEHRVKVSLRSPLMLPTVALVDPELTYNLPSAITASTGLDALTQLIEPYVSARANPMTDAICLDGLRRAARSLRLAYDEGHNTAAREDMALASLFGGLALANAGLGAVHGFAGPIGGMFPAPHGAVCAALLPHVMRTNVKTLRERQSAGDALSRYQTVAVTLTGQSDATVEAGVDWVRSLVKHLQIPNLATYGIKPEHCADLVEKAANASSMKANPIALTQSELASTLAAAL